MSILQNKNLISLSINELLKNYENFTFDGQYLKYKNLLLLKIGYNKYNYTIDGENYISKRCLNEYNINQIIKQKGNQYNLFKQLIIRLIKNTNTISEIEKYEIKEKNKSKFIVPDHIKQQMLNYNKYKSLNYNGLT